MTLGQLIMQYVPGDEAQVVIHKRMPDGGYAVIAGNWYQDHILGYMEEEARLDSWVGGVMRVTI